jgi:hypothetical protein
MNAIAAPKSSAQNRLEGFALTFLLQGFPTFAGAALLLKIAHHEIAGGVVLFVVLTSAPRRAHARSRRNLQSFSGTATSRCSSTPACRLSGRSSGAPSRRRRWLLTNVMLLSLLPVGVMNMR